MSLRAAVALGLVLCSGAVAACGESLGPGARRLTDTQTELVYRTEPESLSVGNHFVLEIAICHHGNTSPPTALQVDAHMPAHRHGMNYRPSVRERGPGLYRAEGLMLHMPGQWELVFELRSATGTVQRLTQTLSID